VKVYPATSVVGAGTEPPAAQILDPFGGAVLTEGVFVG
jgi:hypothetical protein